MRTTFAKTKRSQERRRCDALQAEKRFRLVCARLVGLWSIPAFSQLPKNFARVRVKRFCVDGVAQAFLLNDIIFAPAFFRTSRSARNRMGRVDRDFSGNSANVCTSKAMVPASRARMAQMNSSMPARFRAGLHSARGQSANEKQPGNVLAAMARNGPG